MPFPVTLQQRYFLQNQPFTTLLSVTSAASSCLVNRQRERAFMSVCMYCTSVCVCVCGFVYVCVKQRWSERGSVRVRGENEAGHKGCTEDQHREGGEGKTKEWWWWCWRWWWGGGGAGCSSRLPTAPCSTLQAHTLTSKWYPLSARGLVGPCPPPMSLHTSSCSC